MTFLAPLAAGALTVPLLLITPVVAGSDPARPPPGHSSISRSATAARAAENTTPTSPVATSLPNDVGAGAGAGRSPSIAVAQSRARGRWAWPLNPRPAVVRAFSISAQPWDPGHRGVDLAAVPGTPVLAPADGLIHFSGELAGRFVVSIDHGGGVLSSFEPVIGTVAMGSAVHRGDVIGHVEAGHSHCVPSSCLHWGVREGRQYVNPLTLPGIWGGHVILLPLGAAS